MSVIEWTSIILSVLFFIGGGICTIIWVMLGFIVRRLINSIDKLVQSTEELKIAMNNRPVHDQVKGTAIDEANKAVTEHEARFKHERLN